MKTAMKIEKNPAHVSQPMEWNLRTLAQAATTMVARNDHHTVQAACVERALRPVETPRMPDPVQRIYLIELISILAIASAFQSTYATR